jgi:hypothetical protein
MMVHAAGAAGPVRISSSGKRHYVCPHSLNERATQQSSGSCTQPRCPSDGGLALRADNGQLKLLQYQRMMAPATVTDPSGLAPADDYSYCKSSDTAAAALGYLALLRRSWDH